MPSRNVPLTPLGKNGPKVPVLGLGLMGLSKGPYGDVPDDEQRFAFLDRAFELGCTFWDSADLYGDSEELIGRWFKRTGKRDQIFLSTKFGFIKGNKDLEVDSSGEYCKKACEESLRILGVDYIDLFYMHHANPKTPIEETMRALAQLQAEGKIKHIGLSSIGGDSLRRAVKIAPVAAVQTDYSPFNLDIEAPISDHLLATCRELQVPLVVAMPFARGILTDTFARGEDLNAGGGTDVRAVALPRFQDGNREKNVEIARRFKELADKKGCTTAQLSLAWLRKQGNDIIPIPGTKQIKYLEQNWASLDVELTDEEEAEVRKFIKENPAAGHYLPPSFASYAFTKTVEE